LIENSSLITITRLLLQSGYPQPSNDLMNFADSAVLVPIE